MRDFDDAQSNAAVIELDEVLLAQIRRQPRIADGDGARPPDVSVDQGHGLPGDDGSRRTEARADFGTAKILQDRHGLADRTAFHAHQVSDAAMLLV